MIPQPTSVNHMDKKPLFYINVSDLPFKPFILSLPKNPYIHSPTCKSSKGITVYSVSVSVPLSPPLDPVPPSPRHRRIMSDVLQTLSNTLKEHI